ncbi:choice-of-anchor D domain-containing protein [Chryseobacterium sp. VAUSW3]|uniref:choice-of-anchor D domain-containing protein n=1 Tax=Chryseobacterium sp. VAUSW3 TaxID=2010998 RepID=UPI0015CE273E|nr:choice-of-anchor D domain-containing protein [Chryseobacterium sp. VAUSW3]
MKEKLPSLKAGLFLLLLFASIITGAQIQSAQDGNWNSGTTWIGGMVPADNEQVIINAGHTVSVNSPITRTAATMVIGSFQINTGGFAGGTSFTYDAAATLVFDNGASIYDVFNTAAFWPIPQASRPRNVVVKPGGGIKLHTSRTISVNLQTEAGIYLNTGNTLTLNGIVQIKNGGYFADTPIYGSNSTLIYDTTTTYPAGNEWTGGGTNTVTAGLGVPDNVIVQNSTTLTLSGPRGVSGNFTVQNNAKVNLGGTYGDDLYLKGNFSVLDAAVFNPNNRAVVFARDASQQQINSTNPLLLHYVKLAADGSGGSQIVINNNLTITAPLGGDVVQFTSDLDRFYINNKLLTLGTPGIANTVSGDGRFWGVTELTAANTSDLTILGNGSIGTLRFATDRYIRNLNINRESGKIGAVLGTNLTVLNQLNLQKGILDLYKSTLTIGSAGGGSIVQAAPQASNYIIADGDNGGVLRKSVNSSFSSFIFPVGDSENSTNGMQYSPIELKTKITGNGYFHVKVFNKKKIESDTNYLDRYWELGQTGIALSANPKYEVNATYNASDIVGTESSFFNYYFDSESQTWSGSNGKPKNSVINIKATLFADGQSHSITAGEKAKKREIIVSGNGIEINPGDATPEQFDNTYFGIATNGNYIDKTFVIKNVGSATLQVTGMSLVNDTATGVFEILNPITSQENLGAGASRSFTVRFNASNPIGDKWATITITSNDPIKPNYTFRIKGTVNDFTTCDGFSIVRIQNFEATPASPTYTYSVTEDPLKPDTFSVITGGKAYAKEVLANKFVDGQSLQVFNAFTTVNFDAVNLSATEDPYLIVDLAAFGYTSTEGPATGDYILFEVSPDNGATWYPQIRINASNKISWPFGVNNPEYIKNYDESFSPTIIAANGNNGSFKPSSRYFIKGLPKTAMLLTRIVMKSTNDARIWALDNVMIVDNTSTKIWNGAAWSGDGTPPTISKKAIINGNYDTSISGSFNTCECVVNTGAKLTVSTGTYVQVENAITNYGDLIVKSDGNLKQNFKDAENTGDIKVRREFTWSPNSTPSRREYNFLSSPVALVSPFTMKHIFGNDAANVPAVTVLREPTNSFVNAVPADYGIPAKGFAVREARMAYEGVPAEGIASNEAQFKGKPNNGDILLSLSYTPGRGYNLAGNPYPSNMDIVELYNDPNTKNIHPEFRFWDNVVNDIYVQMGGAYQGYSYAIFNAATDATAGYGIVAPGNGTGGPEGLKKPGRVIKVSQGFMVRANAAGAQLSFRNSMRRTTNAGTEFFGKESPRNRYRLQLVKADGFTIQNAIAYFDAGNNEFGIEDTRIPNSSASDALFTYAGDAKVVINGRSSFTAEDVLTLGTRHYTAGSYTIQAVDEEGEFARGQAIYLKDKTMGIITDLTKGDYVFESEAGEYTDRFEIVYTPALVLAADTAVKGQIEIYRDAADFVVRSSDRIISRVEVYDASGRLVISGQGRERVLRFSADRLQEGIYVVKAHLKDGEHITKKIRK